MVVQIQARCFASISVPSKDKSILLVDADRMKAFQIPTQFLEMIAGWHAQVLVSRRIVNHLKFSKQASFEITWNPLCSDIFDKEISQPVISEARDHLAIRP